MIGNFISICFAIGVLCIPAYLAKWRWNEFKDDCKYWSNEKPPYLSLAIMLLIGYPIAILIASIPWAFQEYSNSPDLTTLKKGEWACTVYRENYCEQYSRVQN